VNEILTGDCRDILPRWISAGVRAQTCVTSPPYWGLRDYGVTGQLGLEPTVDEYVANMVSVLRLVREVLADDGTLWLNLGDCYAQGIGSARGKPYKRHSPVTSCLWAGTRLEKRNIGNNGVALSSPGLKPKDLIGIPWRVAFALQADGWYLRSDIIWAKPNPMPESVTDRPTKSHDYIFLLSKRERYFYDAEAIKERSTTFGSVPEISNMPKGAYLNRDNAVSGYGFIYSRGPCASEFRNRRSVWTVASEPYAEAHFATFPTKLIEPCVLAGSRPGDIVLDPFIGSGTTARVAQRLGRQYLGCELNPQYVAMCDERTRDTIGMQL
jgi:DNA modification methylase